MTRHIRLKNIWQHFQFALKKLGGRIEFSLSDIIAGEGDYNSRLRTRTQLIDYGLFSLFRKLGFGTIYGFTDFSYYLFNIVSNLELCGHHNHTFLGSGLNLL